MSRVDSLSKAKGYAFLLLKFRLRSEKELYLRLKKKEFSNQIINETIAFLKDKRFIGDKEFAKAWIESRLRKNLGFKRIALELVLKGIDQKVIDSSIEDARKDYCEEAAVAELIREKLAKTTGVDQEKIKRRIYGFLLRRGFLPEIAQEALNKI